MAETICYEVYSKLKNINKMRRVLVDKHGFIEKENSYGVYFYKEISSLDSWKIRTVLNIRQYKYRSFNKRYERGTGYRKTFFDTHNGPHRCAYCGKNLKKDYIEVDHLIPVAKAKSKQSVRVWLRLCGIKNVNDPRNLVASCKKCNRKKSDKMGLWVVRGFLGRFKVFWTIRDIVILTIIAIAIFVICANYQVFDYLENIIVQLSS